MKKLGLVVLVTLVMGGAMADTVQGNPMSKRDENRRHNFYGVGLNACGQYLAEREKDGGKLTGTVGLIHTSWFHGYASGFNQFSDGQVAGQLEQPTVVAYFDKWCRDNPLGAVLGAAMCLVEAKGGSPLDYVCKQ